jgi:hypothetical protein
VTGNSECAAAGEGAEGAVPADGVFAAVADGIATAVAIGIVS